MSNRAAGQLPLGDIASPRFVLSRASSDPTGPSAMMNGGTESPWAKRRAGAKSNRSSPDVDGNIVGSALSLQSINVTSNGGRVMEQLEMIFVNEPDPRFVCPACEKVMRYPIQFEECGHRCCTACLHNIVKVAPRCPIDQIKIDPRNTFVDKAFQRDIEALLVKCVNVGKGCQWSGSIAELKTHMEACEFTPVVCPKNCGLTFGRCFLVRHIVDDCPRRDVQCDFCCEKIVYAEEIEHMRICNKFAVVCPNGCGMKDLLRGQLEEHIKECPKATVECPFINAGCSRQMDRRSIEDHLDVCFEEHYQMVAEAMIALKSALADREAQIVANVERLRLRTRQLAAVNSDTYIWRIENWSEVSKKARSGRTTSTSINGPHITTGTLGLGYRITPVVYPYGEGIDQGRFMSIFICLCRTDADSLLSWPFEYRVTVTLIDQCKNPDQDGTRLHVSHTIDPKSESLKVVGRPTTDRGPQFGIRQFINLGLMNVPDHFVVDDCIMLRIQFENDDDSARC